MSKFTSTHSFLFILVPAAALIGCMEVETPDEDSSTLQSALTPDEAAGKILFEEETFDGNGRTCEVCHSGADKTIDPAEVEARFQADPNDPLFVAIDSDDGTGASFDMLRNHAVVRVTLPLPSNIRLADDPGATTVSLWRGVPTTNNISGTQDALAAQNFPTLFNYDGRAEESNETQAEGAVFAHYEPGRAPTATELFQIGEYQRTLFSRANLEAWATDFNAPKPHLPSPVEPSAKRGKGKFNSNCKICHGGPALANNASFGRFTAVSGGVPGGGSGSRFEDATTFVNPTNPVREWIFTLEDGSEQLVTSPDPGRALITGDIGDTNRFKVPGLWGIKDTAPYFSDAHAKTLRESVAHYQELFEIWDTPNFSLSDEDVDDITAFLELL